MDSGDGTLAVMNSVYFPGFHELRPSSSSPPPEDPNTRDRICSVRGCNALLSPDYNHKMCDACRGRHRIYATTKRAKRKAEKASVVGALADDSDDPIQAVNSTPEYNGSSSKDPAVPTWMASRPSPNSGVQLTKPQANNSRSPVASEPLESTSRLNDYTSPDTWDHGNSNIDPRLFQSSSELAGALTYGNLTAANQGADSRATAPVGLSSPSPDLSYNAKSISPSGSSTLHQDDPTSLLRAQTPLTASRYCSIKGCKAVISGDSFFKMCNACRNRYRGYGITKRAKWKRERDDANDEIERLKGEVDRHRSDSLPTPSPIFEYPSWGDSNQFHRTNADHENASEEDTAFSVKMCTVSHCRQILPPDYEFRRCEQHRLQNRHHSKLKREREKDVKAQARSSWAGGATPGDAQTLGAEPPSPILLTPKERERTVEPLFTTIPMDFRNRESKEKRILESGVPPAPGGITRTNHVCSVEVCHNLLDPKLPWKMCGRCRERDISVRKNNPVRDSLDPVDPASVDDCSSASSPSAQPDAASETSSTLKNMASCSSTILPETNAAKTPTPSALVSTNSLQLADPSLHDDSSNLLFAELMLPDMPDTISPDTQVTTYASASIETFTSVFQASVTPIPAQPDAIRVAKPPSPSSALAITLPLPASISDTSITGPPSDLDSRHASNVPSNGRRKSRKKKGPLKRRGKVVDVLVIAPVPDLPPSSQDTQIMPNTVSPQTVEINPSNYLPDATTPASLPSNPSFTFSQYSMPPYTTPFAPPMLPYYMPPPFSASPYGPPQFSYPHAYPYGRPPYYGPPPLPYMPASYRVPPYPYQYSYSQTSYFNPSGNTTPSYTPISYPQLQWSTTITPQAPPPEYVADNDGSTSIAQPKPIDHQRKRKRDEGDNKTDDPSISLEVDDGGHEGVAVIPSYLPPEVQSGSADPAEFDAVPNSPSSKKQSYLCGKKSCNRIVSSSNILCDRCKERLKKWQMKIKKRFRLEPRAFVGKYVGEDVTQSSSFVST